jgi:hypothetical protein
MPVAFSLPPWVTFERFIMAKSNQQIIDEITAHIQKRGGAYGTWYVSTGQGARGCPFGDHQVKKRGDRWIRRRAQSSAAAHEVADYLVHTLATDGQTGGDEAADLVYAYRKAPHTRP